MSYSSTGLQRTKTTGGALQLGFRIDGSHELFGGVLQLGFRVGGSHQLIGGTLQLGNLQPHTHTHTYSSVHCSSFSVDITILHIHKEPTHGSRARGSLDSENPPLPAQPCSPQLLHSNWVVAKEVGVAAKGLFSKNPPSWL